VKKVVRDVDLCDRTLKVVAVCGVAVDHLDLVDPRMEAQALGVTGHDTDPIAMSEKFADESPTDVSRRPGDEAQRG
jgi:hypothetical protein